MTSPLTHISDTARWVAVYRACQLFAFLPYQLLFSVTQVLFPMLAKANREEGPERVAELVAREGWYCDLSGLRYLSHFITPRSSPIRFSARFFLCRAPGDQAPRLFTEETSEGFWIHPGAGYRRFLADELAMAEPAEYGLAYLAQFASLDDLWTAHEDRRHKFHGIVDRIDVFWDSFDWKANRFPAGGAVPGR